MKKATRQHLDSMEEQSRLRMAARLMTSDARVIYINTVTETRDEFIARCARAYDRAEEESK